MAMLIRQSYNEAMEKSTWSFEEKKKGKNRTSGNVMYEI